MIDDKVKQAYDKGYRILNDGVIIGLRGQVVKGDIDMWNYRRFKIRDVNGKNKNIKASRLQAYQKFGDTMFKDGIVVRHLNGDSLMDTKENIVIGTESDNRMDIPQNIRQQMAQKAASKTKRFSDDQIREIRKDREDGFKLQGLVEKYGATKGNISDIVNRKLYKNVE